MRKNYDPRDWADTLPSQFGPYESLPPGAEPQEPLFGTHPAPAASPVSPATPQVLGAPEWPWHRWIREGLRGTLLRAPARWAVGPGPWQTLALVLLPALLLLAVDRWGIDEPVTFDVRAWLAPWWTTLVLAWMAWWAMAPRQDLPPRSLAAWMVLTAWSPWLPTALLYGLMGWMASAPGVWASKAMTWLSWGLYVGLLLWVVAALVCSTAALAASRWRTAGFALGLLAVLAAATWWFPDRPWVPDRDSLVQSSDDDLAAPPALALRPEVFEDQQALWLAQADALLPERPGVTDLYALVFAPYADEEVFRRESTMVARLMAERFDAQGRVLHLLNHAQTSATHAWATPANLRRAVKLLAQRMDREHDVLFVYLTSHGAQNHALAATLAPLQMEPLTPRDVREALDAAGIRHRVIAVSACYSGGWVEPLATPATLVMTAADADHTSYGCGTRSELTFFGRAVFHEQLRQTHSFVEAFQRAVPVIARREREAGKNDGFSNPQIRVGPDIVPTLQALQARLAGI
ncbi:MAG: C13 family peptidase [Burkholderiaceae bacterium]